MNTASSLANVYAYLLRKYDTNYMITYSTSPTYLANIIGSDEVHGKIVLFYVEDRSKVKTNFTSPSKLKISKPKSDDLDLTGSPLKDDCEMDAIDEVSIDMNLIISNPWKLEEEYHQGIPVEKVRTIMSSEEFQRGSSAKDAAGSVWFLCSGTDASKTLLLQYEFAPYHFQRGVITYMGIVPTYSVTTQTLLHQHYSLMGKGSSLKTFIANTYNVKSNMSLKCTWSTSSMVPSLIDLNTCEVTLKQTYRLCESTPATEVLINQLRILMTIRDDILTHKLAENSDISREPVYRCGIGIEMGELRENINKVMTEISEIDSSNSTAERDIEEVIQSANTRKLSDLTDKLWDILKQCSSYKDLKMAFNILFQCAARCNIVNTPTNKNRLAEIITEVANRRLAIPCLSGSEPLELLLEIGLEKLYKDYEYIFVESKICSANDLKNKSVPEDNKENAGVVPNVRKSLRNAVMQDSAALRKTLLHNDVKHTASSMTNDILGFKNSNFDEHETAKTISKLLQIHCTLEHLLMIHLHLNITSVYYEVCDQLLRKPPRMVDSINDSLEDEMEIQLSVHYIREHLEGKDPHSRRITMESKNKIREVKTTFYYSMENVFPPNISEWFGTEEKEYSKENIYYSWLYRKITTIKNH